MTKTPSSSKLPPITSKALEQLCLLVTLIQHAPYSSMLLYKANFANSDMLIYLNAGYYELSPLLQSEPTVDHFQRPFES